MTRPHLTELTLVSLLATVFCGCEPAAIPPGADGGVPRADGGGFDDFTVPRIESRAELEALSAPGPRPEVKFVISPFGDPARRTTRYLDSAEYTLHDEWYWFRLLNGQPIDSDPETAPVSGLSFAHVEEIKSWAKGRETLPLDLRWVNDGRLYSPRFYQLALAADARALGVGKIFRVPARTEPPIREERFVFELEYQDSVSKTALEIFFQELESSLPSDIAEELVWVVRSPVQEALAGQLTLEGHPLAPRIIRYSDLVVPGELEIYGEGLTAGRLRVVRAEHPEQLALARSTEVLLTDFIPDYLPPAVGLVTGVPQTPLAHIAVLARNRGIPNAYRGGILDDPEIDQLERGYAPVVLRAKAPGQLDLKAITEAQYRTYQSLTQKSPISVDPIDLSNVPYVFDLSAYSLAQVDALRPVVGGKAAGFIALLSAEGVETPDRPLAISIRAYREHLEAFAEDISAMLADPEFDGPRSSSKIRFLVLEGPTDYDVAYPAADDQALEASFLGRHPADRVGELVRAGGLRRKIRDAAMNPATIAAIEAAIAAHYSDYSNLQGLRFRSSSNVEDIEGFNGAGLYDSNTGFLDPSAQPDPSDQTHSIEWAIKKTWASYWAFEAFEERRTELVEHESGSMGVVVHARFDDAFELSNGVVLYTILPASFDDEAVMELNVQTGPESVTNPTGGSLPEVDRVTLSRTGEIRIERLRGSTLLPAGAQVLGDAELRELFDDAGTVTRTWLEAVNLRLRPSQTRTTLTLDMEIREVAEGWPRLREGLPPRPRRMVLKQSRSLEPGARGIPEDLFSLPIPRDVLTRASRVERRVCTSERIVVGIVEAFTDPLLQPDFGYSRDPLTASIFVRTLTPIPDAGWDGAFTIDLDHSEVQATHPGLADGGPWQLDVAVPAESDPEHGIRRVRLDSTFGLTVETSSAAVSQPLGRCTPDVLYATPRDFLMSLIR
ncbi:MAG: hypothetical protein HYV07_23405 [Deltaproteobacteria bacterium]|nr:hypothetical protein [Deltaproteobacteria bacterium]